jgi:hypothetical protein
MFKRVTLLLMLALPLAAPRGSGSQAEAREGHGVEAGGAVHRGRLRRALALAKERKLPVFIEGWAPW